jgi:hypothetical protein
MADVFISYAREDRECARILAENLEHRGLIVWWDRLLLGGDKFDLVIEQEIANARAVIVVWSASSVGSEYVRAEAARAHALKKLVPVRTDIDDAQLPMFFALSHVIDISPWLALSKSGGGVRAGSQAAGDAFGVLIKSLQRYLERPPIDPNPASEPKSPESPPEQPPSFRWDARRHRNMYDTFAIVEDDDWVVVKIPPQLRDDASGTRIVVKKGVVVRKPN